MKSIAETVEVLRERAVREGFEFFPPTPPSLIREFEMRLGQPLPQEFREFYQLCGGFVDEDTFQIIPLDEILSRGDVFPPDEFIFAEFLIYCGIWKVKIAAPPETHFYILDHVVRLTNSLAAFLDVWLRGGLYGEGGLLDLSEKAK